MKEHIVELKDLTDSRELLFSKTPLIMSVFIYSLLIMLVIIFIWLWFGKLEISVKSTGIIRPVESISSVKNIVNGEVVDINFYDGTEVNKGDILYKIDTDPFEIEKDAIKVQLDKNIEELRNLSLLEKSIDLNINYFNKIQTEFYNKFILYQYKIEHLTLEYKRVNKEYLNYNSLPEGSIAKSKLEEYKFAVKLAELNKNKFISEYKINLKEEIKKKEIVLDDLKKSLMRIEKNLDYCVIKAPIDGNVQLVYQFNLGDYVQSGLEVLKIIPKNNSKYKVEVIVSNNDIANIKTGDIIQYRFAALPHTEYGNLTGRIINIPFDITSVSDNNEAFYIIDGSLDSISLYDKKNKKINIKNGMICNTRIIIKRKKILFILLEKLDFIS